MSLRCELRLWPVNVTLPMAAWDGVFAPHELAYPQHRERMWGPDRKVRARPGQSMHESYPVPSNCYLSRWRCAI
jgi:hypothetical protein